jgi:hypothetical protein
MESLTSRPIMVREARRLLGLALCGSVLCGLMFSAGCVTLPLVAPPKEAPPTGPVSQVLATWSNKVVFNEEILHNGIKTAGLAGRLYFFSGDSGFPVKADGNIDVAFYDASGEKPSETPLGEWHFDRKHLNAWLCKDNIGWGYTLFLPWPTYRPEVTKVMMVVKYVPSSGLPVFAPSSTVTLNSGAGIVVQNQRVPANSPSAGLLSPSLRPDLQRVDPPPPDGPTRIPLPTSRNSALGRLVPQ